MGWLGFVKKHLPFFLQLMLLLLVAAVFALTDGWLGFRSALFGGSAWLIPDIYFIQKQRSIKTTFNTSEMFKKFLLSELFKLLLSFIIITSILLIFVISRRGFLSGYIAMILISFVASFGRGIRYD